MGLLEDVKNMRQEGKTELEVIENLRDRGLSDANIQDALAHAKIKEEVMGQSTEMDSQGNGSPSIMNAPSAGGEEEELIPTQSRQLQAPQAGMQMPQQAEEQGQAYYQAPSGYNQGYQYAPGAGMSSDTITEIAEQVLSEKLYPLRNQLEKVSDLRTTVESKIAYLEERLKRIEGIIDRLQLSVLQKVGEYVTDVSDLKRELIETQKSFKTLAPHHHHQKE